MPSGSKTVSARPTAEEKEENSKSEEEEQAILVQRARMQRKISMRGQIAAAAPVAVAAATIAAAASPAVAAAPTVVSSYSTRRSKARSSARIKDVLDSSDSDSDDDVERRRGAKSKQHHRADSDGNSEDGGGGGGEERSNDEEDADRGLNSRSRQRHVTMAPEATGGGGSDATHKSQAAPSPPSSTAPSRTRSMPTAAATATTGRLSDSQQEAYVRHCFPILNGFSSSLVTPAAAATAASAHSSSSASSSRPVSDPYSLLTLASMLSREKEPRSSPHIVSLSTGGTEERKTNNGGGGGGGAAPLRAAGSVHARGHAAQTRGGEPEPLPLYLSKGIIEATASLQFPALSARALASTAPAGGMSSSSSHSLLDGSGESDGGGRGGAVTARQMRRIRGLEKAKLAMAVAQQVDHNLHETAAATERALHRHPRQHQHQRGASTARPHAASTDSLAAPEHSGGGGAEQPVAAEEEKTFLTAMSPFSLPDSLESVASGGATGGGWHSSPAEAGPGAAGVGGARVMLDSSGLWAGPAPVTATASSQRRSHRRRHGHNVTEDELSPPVVAARLLDSQQRFSRWHAQLTHLARALFAAKCRDQGLSAIPSSLHMGVTGTGHASASSSASVAGRRESRWLGLFMKRCRSGLLGLSEAGLGAHSVGPLCEVLVARLVPDSVLSSPHPTHFRVLDLARNNLGDEGAEMLAAALQAAPHVQSVNLASNKISAHGIAKICAALSTSTSLTSLDLSSSSSSSPSSDGVGGGVGVANSQHGKNYVGPGLSGARGLRLLLDRSRSLGTLALVGLGLGLVRDSLAEVCAGVANSQSITTLDLSDNGLNETDAPVLCTALAAASTAAAASSASSPAGGSGGVGGASVLTTLLLRRNLFGSVGLSRFARLLHDVHTLTRLDLSRNEAGLSGWVLLSDCLAPNLLLDRLVLDGNDFSSLPGPRAAAHERRLVVGSGSGVGSGRGRGSHATEGMLANLAADVRVPSLRGRFVSASLGINESLRSLSLQHCGLRDGFVVQLLQVLTSHRVLTSLSLAHNDLGRSGGSSSSGGGGGGGGECGEALARFLRSDPPLRILDLGHNMLDDSSGAMVVRALTGVATTSAGLGTLKPNNHLTQLNMAKNDLGEATALELLNILNAAADTAKRNKMMMMSSSPSSASASAFAASTSSASLSSLSSATATTPAITIAAGGSPTPQCALTLVNVDDNPMPYHLWRSIVDLCSVTSKRYAAGALERQQAEVAALSRAESALRETEAAVDRCTLEDASESLRLADLEGDQSGWVDSERRVATNLKAQADSLIEEHRALIAREFAIDVDIKKKRAEMEALVESKRKEWASHKAACVAAEKQIARCKEGLAAAASETHQAFDESDRLLILILAHEKRNIATCNLIEQDVGRLAEWIKALQKKMDRGETNPYAPVADSAAAPSLKRRPSVSVANAAAPLVPAPPAVSAAAARAAQLRRKASVATSALLPRTLEGSPILPASSKFSGMFGGGAGGILEEDEEDFFVAPPAPLMLLDSPSTSSMAAAAAGGATSTTSKSKKKKTNKSPKGSPRARKNKKAAASGVVSTLLRPTAPPTDAVMWSAPVTSGGAVIVKSKKKKKQKQGKTDDDVDAASTSVSNSVASASPSSSSSSYTYAPHPTGASVASAAPPLAAP